MENQDDLKTQPTATAIMERLQSVEARLLGEMGTLATRKEMLSLATRKEMLSLKEELTNQFTHQTLSLKEELTSQFTHQTLSLKEELTAQFARLSTKIEVLNDDILTVRAGQRDILKRMSESEEKVKAS